MSVKKEIITREQTAERTIEIAEKFLASRELPENASRPNNGDPILFATSPNVLTLKMLTKQGKNAQADHWAMNMIEWSKPFRNISSLSQ